MTLTLTCEDLVVVLLVFACIRQFLSFYYFYYPAYYSSRFVPVAHYFGQAEIA